MRRFVTRRGAISLIAATEDGAIAGFVIVHLERAGAGVCCDSGCG